MTPTEGEPAELPPELMGILDEIERLRVEIKQEQDEFLAILKKGNERTCTVWGVMRDA